jgi:hypothetical protein
MMGRDEYSGAWCIYCVLKQSQWTTIHGDNDEGKCNYKANLWMIEMLHGVAVIQMQKDALDRTYEILWNLKNSVLELSSSRSCDSANITSFTWAGK